MQLDNSYQLAEQENTRQFFRYVIAGVINTLAGFITYAFCIKLLSMPFWLANFFTTIAGIICGFILARNYVFPNSEKKTTTTLPKYILTIGLQFVVSTSLIAYFRTLGLDDILSYIATLPIIIILSYGIQKIWVFQTPSDIK